MSLKENAKSFHSIVNTNTDTVHSVRLYNTNIHNNKVHRSLMWKFMLCKGNCNRMFLYLAIIWAYLDLFCEVSANISSMNKSLRPWRLKWFNLLTKKLKKKKVCVPTCPHLYFCCCCHWCLLVLHNIFEYDKRYIITIYHQGCSFCIYIQWLPFAKKKKKRETIWANVI